MNLDDLPIHWGFVFQVLVFASIFLMLWEMDVAGKLDRLRWGSSQPWMFRVRRGTMMLKALALCWVVIYSSNRGWQPWPPIVGFLVAFDLYVIFNTLVMRDDLSRTKEERSSQSVSAVRR